MEHLLPGYLASDEAWLLLSLPVIVAIFFRFGRLLSSRNLDLVILLSLSPGLLLVRKVPTLGYSWLGIVAVVLLLRLVWDCRFKRRPRVECNLNRQGLITIGIFAFVFLTISAIGSVPAEPVNPVVKKTLNKISKAVSSGTSQSRSALSNREEVGDKEINQAISRTISVLGHLAVAIALLIIAWKHFRDPNLGWEMVVLYLLLPCTSYNIDKAIHVIPTALLLWAVVAYRHPYVAGLLTGLACGILFFPIFLLPLWCAFYKRKHAVRFAGALLVVTTVLLLGVALTSVDQNAFYMQTFGAIRWKSLFDFSSSYTQGFWSVFAPAYRLPVFAAFVALLIGLNIWPRKKNLEHLLAHSAAIIVGIQFWSPGKQGEFLLWCLPFVLLVVFRPQLSIRERHHRNGHNHDERRLAQPQSHLKLKGEKEAVDSLLP